MLICIIPPSAVTSSRLGIPTVVLNIFSAAAYPVERNPLVFQAEIISPSLFASTWYASLSPTIYSAVPRERGNPSSDDTYSTVATTNSPVISVVFHNSTPHPKYARAFPRFPGFTSLIPSITALTSSGFDSSSAVSFGFH